MLHNFPRFYGRPKRVQVWHSLDFDI